MSDTPNLVLPFLEAAQAQKHVTVNDGLLALDAIVQLSVLDRDFTSPPGSNTDGERYLVAAGATGEWAGKDGYVAAYQDGVWNFYQPKSGWRLWVADEAVLLAHDGTAWLSVGGSGGGASDFLGLTDTPASFAGSGSYLVRVNATETALEFIDPAGFGGSGEANDGANVGSGADVFRDKTSLTLNFRGILGIADELSAVVNGDNVDIGLADNPIVPGTGRIKLPVGTTAQRPGTPANGDARYNSTDNKFEAHAGGAWVRFSVEGHVHAAGDIISGTFADARVAQSNVTQHEAAITHDNLSGAGSNTHAQIDSHIGDAAKHREINDAGTATTELWSASKIDTELSGKSSTSHNHDSDYSPLGALAGINTQTGTTYTLALADAGKLVEMNNASANTLTVPPNSSVAFAVGTELAVSQLGAGATSVEAGTGVTIRASDGSSLSGGQSKQLANQHSVASLVKRATDEWYLTGAFA